MGYPMTFPRLMGRTHHRIGGGAIFGDMDIHRAATAIWREVESDLERLKKNSLDSVHLPRYAEKAGITPEQAGIVLEEFFKGGLVNGVNPPEEVEEAMNSRIFARKWLEQNGLFDTDSDYDGWLGTTTMEVVELIASQGHTGMSGPRLIELLMSIYYAYTSVDHPIWQEYWQSDEGKALIRQSTGGSAAEEQAG